MNESHGSDFRSRLISASRLDLPYSSPRISARDGVPASVLIAWGFSSTLPNDPQVLLTRRTGKVETHKGQMAFPGGGRDPEDESAIATALREAQEEVGLDPAQVEVLGTLPELWTITNFIVTPVLAIVRAPIEELHLVHHEHEVEETLWVSLSRLRDSYRREHVVRGAIRYPIDVFLEEPYRVWGVTGSVLKNLVERLERLG
jgi:8-oxo-dGTP pyrophosphatase MutT (NUDIX family)